MSSRQIVSRLPFQRSAVTNGTRMLVGINGRSALARRYRDLVEALAAEIGADLGEAELLQVRNAASLQLHAEELTARLVRGEPVDPEAITRATNGATRALAGLRRRKAPAARATPTLDAYRSGRAAE